MTREPPADEYSLLAWATDQERDALIAAEQTKIRFDRHGWKCRAIAFNEMANKIRSGRINQRPHFDGM